MLLTFRQGQQLQAMYREIRLRISLMQISELQTGMESILHQVLLTLEQPQGTQSATQQEQVQFLIMAILQMEVYTEYA